MVTNVKRNRKLIHIIQSQSCHKASCTASFEKSNSSIGTNDIQSKINSVSITKYKIGQIGSGKYVNISKDEKEKSLLKLKRKSYTQYPEGLGNLNKLLRSEAVKTW